MATKGSLDVYRKKRDFARTREPSGKLIPGPGSRFVVHEHHASSLHYDLRLEMGGVLKSWAVPKGPTLDPKVRRLAIQTEDHPVQYLDFEGTIADGQYGAGEVRVWDIGGYSIVPGGDPVKAWSDGRLHVDFQGSQLKGAFMLVRSARSPKQWLLFKIRDGEARADWTPAPILPYGSRKEKPGSAEGAGAAAPREKRRRPAKPGPAEKSGGPAVTHPEKIYWPLEGVTKGDLIRYYEDVSPWLLPHLKDRPLILNRFPDGIEGASFHQHNFPKPPPFLETVREHEEERGTLVQYALCQNLESLVYLANLGAISLHPFLSRVPGLERPDFAVFDLDPQEVPFREVCRMAFFLGELLEAVGVTAYAKTSGSTGIHVHVPLRPDYDFKQSFAFAHWVAAWAIRERPDAFTLERSLKARPRDRIYLDCMQNARGKSVACAYSARARPGATVSAPVTWNELKVGVRMEDFTLKSMPARLKKKGDLFAGVLGEGNSIPDALQKLEGLLRTVQR